MIRFGPAGTADSFSAMGYRQTAQVPAYLERFGLTAFEYQCGRGVRISTEKAAQLGRLCRERDIALSVHAPYYISMSSLEEAKREGSIRYILETARAARDMGARRIVVHTGSCAKLSREEALALAKDTMTKALRAMDEAGYSQVHICPETMGKVNQLGTLEEVVELCTLDERLIPCIDFGHLNARTFGGYRTKEDFARIFDLLENRLGRERARCFHAHFSKIEYTPGGGEKRHLTFADTVYGPDFDPVAQLLVERGCCPTIICESAGTQTEDAAAMKAITAALGGQVEPSREKEETR